MSHPLKPPIEFEELVERISYLAMTAFKSVDEYIALQPEAVRDLLQRVRCAIRRAVPATEETISYSIPAYKLHNAPVLYFAGWKQHYSIYPVNGPAVAAFKDELAPYTVSKATVRFPFSRPVPVKLIERIARFRANEIREREKAATRKKSKGTIRNKESA